MRQLLILEMKSVFFLSEAFAGAMQHVGSNVVNNSFFLGISEVQALKVQK